MAGGYDGEIRIRTKIDNADIQPKITQTTIALEKSAAKVDKLQDKFNSFSTKIEESNRKASELEKKLEEIQKIKAPTEEYKKILDQWEEAHNELLSAKKELQQMRELGFKDENLQTYIKRVETAVEKQYQLQEIRDKMESSKTAFVDQTTTEAYQEIAHKLSEQNQKTNDLVDAQSKVKAEIAAELAEQNRLNGIFRSATVVNQKLVDLLNEEKQLETQIADMKKAGLTAGYDKYDEAARRLSEVREEIKQINAEQEKVGSGSKQIEKVGKAAKKSAGLMSTLLSRLEGITLSLLIFNWITKAFNAMVAAFKEGIQNMAKYSSDFNSRMSELKSATATLKASLGTLAAPIVSAVIPAIVTLCNWITTAVNKMNELVAALSGKSTWTRAKQQQVDYAKSLNGTAGAAKKAAGALQGFDELNVINSNSSGGGGTDASTMYEEVPTSDALIGKLQPFLDYLKQIKAEVIRGWDETWAALDIDSQIADIRGSIESIRGSLSDIFGNADLQAAADNFVMTLAYSVGQIGASVVSIGATIAQNIIGGIDLYLQQNSGRITEYLIRMFDIGADVAQLAGEAAEAFAFVFQAFGNEDGQQITANLIQIFTDIFGTVTLLEAQFRDDMLHFFIDPFVDNSEGIKTALEGILEVVADVTGTISDTVQHFTDGVVTLYDEHIHPLIQSLTDGLDEISAKFLEFWNTYVQPVLENISTKFHEVMEQHIQPMLDSFLGLLGTVIDNVKKLWEEVLVPVIEWIIENILPVLMPIIQSLIEGVLNFIGFVSDMVANIMDFLSGLIDFIVGIFAGDWEQAWAGIREMFSSIWNSMKLILSTIWNNMKDGVKAAISAIKGHISDSLHNIKGGWRESWTSMKTTVLGIFDAIKSGIKGKINSIISFVENMANSIIIGVNKVLEALNSVGFDMPDWLGGGTFHPNLQTLPAVHIPRLANGGITTGSTFANIGEAGREAVLPLENNLSYLEPLAEMIASKMEGVQTVRIVAEESGIFKVVREGANDYFRRTGRPAFDF
jgi:phage-related protein|nr:MAG TPA: minor tail protein [Siphoviridae sp. ctoD011]